METDNIYRRFFKPVLIQNGWGWIARKLLQQMVLVSSFLIFLNLPQVARGVPPFEYWANPAPSGIWHSDFWALDAGGPVGGIDPGLNSWNDGNSAIFLPPARVRLAILPSRWIRLRSCKISPIRAATAEAL